MGQPKKNFDRKFTYKDYLTWSLNERWELLNGRAYNMTPAPSLRHQEISGQLLTLFNNYLKGKTCRVYAAPFDVRLPQFQESDEQTSTVVQPDLVVVCDKTKLDHHGCKGSPDLVVEITSPSTFQKDLKEKFNLYERVGVREYWIVYPKENTICAFYLTHEGKYSRPEVYTEQDSINVGNAKNHSSHGGHKKTTLSVSVVFLCRFDEPRYTLQGSRIVSIGISRFRVT